LRRVVIVGVWTCCSMSFNDALTVCVRRKLTVKAWQTSIVHSQSNRQRSGAVASCLRPVERICVGVEGRTLHVPILEVFQQVLVNSTSILYRRALLRSQSSDSVGSARKIDRRIVCRKLIVHSGDGCASRAGKNVVAVWRESAVMVDSEYRVEKVEEPGGKVQSESTPVGRIQRRQAPSTWYSGKASSSRAAYSAACVQKRLGIGSRDH
jgi:hypothetical protein